MSGRSGAEDGGRRLFCLAMQSALALGAPMNAVARRKIVAARRCGSKGARRLIAL
jgi:hypothetical protein